MRDALIIFIKNPVIGKVKTRLAATVGNDLALVIYKKLIEHTLTIIKDVNADKYIFFSERIDDNIGDSNIFFKKVQAGTDLGEKMKNAFEQLFKNNYKNICIIGTDCPGISEDTFEEAFTKLNKDNVVMGPAEDGGYYLLGMNKFNENLFNEIVWSTAQVLQTTIEKCIENNLRFTLLKKLSDIDEEKDLIHFDAFKKIINNKDSQYD